MILRAALAFSLAVCAAGAAAAQPFAPDPKNRVSFGVERTRDVANDWVTAVVGTTDEDSDAARLADRVNQTMNWGLGVAKQARGVSVKSGGYATQPIYDSSGKKIARWTASQDLYLEGSDVDAVSELVGKLQSKMLLRSIAFSVSPETRRKAEDELIGEALTAFQERAKRVASGLGSRDYEIVSLSVQTPGGGGPVPMYARAAMEMGKVAQPSFESGQSTLQVRVDATIELEK